MSIAWAIIEFFADDKRKANASAKILFVTHYFELTELSETLKGVVNYSIDVKEWNDDVIFLHKIIKGRTNKSYGIHVAKIAGMPRQVIERAYKILSRLKKNAAESSKYAEIPEILAELKNIDVNALSPIETFNILKNWKERYK
jgi:DNA mismatch repair protein MutS